MSYRLIVGLGNPGSEYEQTRHNIGFQVIDTFASKRGASAWSKNRNLKGDLSVFVPELDEKIYLLKPLTFMNESGVSIQKVCSYYRIPPEEVVVIYDEINLGVGEVKVSTSGGPGGHNGLSDIVFRIKPTFTRLRIGIGQKARKEMSLADYVLGKFSKEDERLELSNQIDKSSVKNEVNSKDDQEKVIPRSRNGLRRMHKSSGATH